MRRNWNKTSWFFVGCLLLISLIASQAATVAVAEDPARFVAGKDLIGDDFEALEDNATGLVWGKCFTQGPPPLFRNAEAAVIRWAEGTEEEPPNLNQTGGFGAWSEENLGGWRLPSLTEVLQALDTNQAGYIGQGLAGSLDFVYEDFVSEDGLRTGQGFQGVNDGAWGDEYFATCCMKKYKSHGLWMYEIRFSDGDFFLTYWSPRIIAVRDSQGLPPNHDLCPRHADDAYGGNSPGDGGGGKPPKGPKK